MFKLQYYESYWSGAINKILFYMHRYMHFAFVSWTKYIIIQQFDLNHEIKKDVVISSRKVKNSKNKLT